MARFPKQPEAICVRPAVVDDASEIIRVHLKSFQGFFLTFLGPAFLRELYEASLQDPCGIGFVAERDDILCGFITGTAHPSGFYRRLLLRRWWRFALASLLPVLKRPSIIPRLLRAFSMPKQSSRKKARATLMSLGVLPEVQCKGIGKELVKAFLNEAARRSLRQVDLTTDSEENDEVNQFYRNLGFNGERNFETPEGRSMTEYVIELFHTAKSNP